MEESIDYEAVVAQLQLENEALRHHIQDFAGIHFVRPTVSLAQIERVLREHAVAIIVGLFILTAVVQMFFLFYDKVRS